jgi:hypothetical protein
MALPLAAESLSGVLPPGFVRTMAGAMRCSSSSTLSSISVFIRLLMLFLHRLWLFEDR